MSKLRESSWPYFILNLKHFLMGVFSKLGVFKIQKRRKRFSANISGGKCMNKMLLTACAGLIISACSQEKATTNSQPLSPSQDVQVGQRVIYGEDNRLDLYQVTDALWKQKTNSTVALMSSSKVTPNGLGGFRISTSAYGSSQSLCKNEPFYEQVTAAFCSGSLIAPDIIMTAGHCVRNQSSCESTKFVFNFAYAEAGKTPNNVGADDVYSCKQLIHSEVNSSNDSDFALIRLDRKVVGHDPLAIRQQGKISDTENIVVIGHPSGLASKIAGGASVRDNSLETYFIANLDTYGGNSGSAVFNEAGLVEGILVRGERDFVYKNGCYVSNVCTNSGCRGEDVTRVSEVLKYVDASELVQESTTAPVAP